MSMQSARIVAAKTIAYFRCSSIESSGGNGDGRIAQRPAPANLLVAFFECSALFNTEHMAGGNFWQCSLQKLTDPKKVGCQWDEISGFV